MATATAHVLAWNSGTDWVGAGQGATIGALACAMLSGPNARARELLDLLASCGDAPLTTATALALTGHTIDAKDRLHILVAVQQACAPVGVR